MGEKFSENSSGREDRADWRWEDGVGWQMGMDRLSSAFIIASVVSYGLPQRDLDLLADYCSLLSHCFRSIAASERRCRD